MSSKNIIISLNIIIFLSYSHIQLFHPCPNHQYLILSHSLICVLFTYFTEKLVAVKEEQLPFSTKPNISSPFIPICVLFTLETIDKIASTAEANSITTVILLYFQGACSCVVSKIFSILWRFQLHCNKIFRVSSIKEKPFLWLPYLLLATTLLFHFYL